MNYYNFSPPTSASTGLFSGLFKGKIKWGVILDNSQKTLNLINQAIPVVKQVPPIYNNAKTMFSVMNEFKKSDTPPTTTTSTINNVVSSPVNNTFNKEYEVDNSQTSTVKKTTNIADNGPTFFL